MPELVYPPEHPVWPPPQAISSAVTKHVVGNTPARPGRNEAHGPVESFLDICDRYRIPFEVLVEFNFGLVKGEPRYFEKINWFLKHKLGCKKTTAKGNFIFSGGETIYILPATIEFTDVPPLIVARPRLGPVRWVKFAVRASPNSPPTYMIPGVDRTSEAPDSKLPGKHGRSANKAEGVAALAQFLATTTANRLGSMSARRRLENLEASVLKGGEGVASRLQPVGPHEGVVVMVRLTRNKQDPSFPQLPFGDPTIVGFGKASEAGDIIEKHGQQPRLFADPGKNRDIVVEFYWGTRLPASK